MKKMKLIDNVFVFSAYEDISWKCDGYGGISWWQVEECVNFTDICIAVETEKPEELW